MVMIKVIEVAKSADTTAEGLALYDAIMKAAARGTEILISFSGVPVVTSSFINASLAHVSEHMSFSEFQRRVKILHSTRQINDMIIRCVKKNNLIAA